MTKIRRVKRRKTFKATINRKRLRNKLRKVPHISCPQIKEAWDVKKSTKYNLVQMGLAYDPNEVLKVPNVKEDSIKTAKQKVSVDDDEVRRRKVPKKIHVAEKLEAEAKAPRERRFRLPKGEVHFLTYLMNKYDDDYKAMALDKKNYYQLTWRQIRQKINTFKGIPEQYAEYLVQKGEIVLDDSLPLEATRKKMGEENLKRYCQAKAPKKKSVVSQWIEESIEDENTFDTEDELEAGKEQREGKKLKLFPDDDTEKFRGNNLVKDSRIKERKDKRKELLGKLSSSDSEELEGEDTECDFKNLSDMSDDELSEDDILNDDEFSMESDEESE